MSRPVTGKGEVRACPECNETQVRRRPGGISSDPPSEAEAYYCDRCQATFREPKIRPIQEGPVRYGLARKLADADPDDVGGSA
ncbi:hypothetical protein [Halopelagius fulvigenes]|uniref:Small CPxCG-related zinc finger protein n=1 Tax=Halopelagius fulvigenes TaxID=1198324 RepID=A0ABD5TYD0_9EURY